MLCGINEISPLDIYSFKPLQLFHLILYTQDTFTQLHFNVINPREECCKGSRIILKGLLHILGV
jgi:hypothetical protein